MTPLSQPVRYSSVVLCTLPLISYLFVVLFWLMASWSLGKWAIPSIHDPGDFLFGIPLYLHAILMCLSFAVAPVALAFGHWRGKLSLHALAYSACMIASILLFRLDLYQVTTWIAD
jgi:hypothetical protein